MKINTNLVLLMLLVSVMLFEPIPLNNVYNSILGKMFILAMVVYFTVNHTVLGLIAVIILISSIQTTNEGLAMKKSKELFTPNLKVIGNDRLKFEDMLRPKKSCCASKRNNGEPEPYKKS